MPQTERPEQDIALPTPRSVWDSEASSPDLTVINQVGSPDTSYRDNDGVISYNVENSPFNLSGKTGLVNESLENILNTSLQENINIINVDVFL